MHECFVIVATTVLFVAHKQEFLGTFKQWERNLRYNMCLLLDFCTRFQERTV